MVEPVVVKPLVAEFVVLAPVLAVLAAAVSVPLLLQLPMHHHMILPVLRCGEVGFDSSR